MKKTICCIMILALALLAIGCQPTPNAKIIVAKDGALEKKIESEPAEVIEYDFPEMFHERFVVTDRLDVYANAEVKVPNGNSYPVYQIEFAPFSSEQASALINDLFGDAEVYKKSSIRTKSAIEAEIINWKRLASEVASGHQSGDLKTYEEMIRQLEKELASAPEGSADIPYDGTMDSNEEGSFLTVYGNLGKKTDATLEIRNYENMKSAILMYQNGTEYWADGGINEQAAELTTTPKDALDIVAQWLQDAQMEDFIPLICRVGSSYQSGDVKGKEGYVINCERHIDGIPVTYNINTKSSTSLNTVPDYSQQFSKEKLTFTLDDSGITTIKWENPFRASLKNKNVPLFSFEDVLHHFKQGLKYKYSWVEDTSSIEGTVDAVTIEVSQIKLGMAIIPEKEKIGGFMLVPAWDFFGTEALKNNEVANVVAYDDRSLITINAIDGSIIE